MKPAILIRCTINSFSPNKLDEGATNKVRTETSSKTAAVVKRLFGKGSLCEEVLTKQTKIRNIFNSMTAPWDERSFRAVSADKFMTVLDTMRKEVYAHDALAEQFYAKYPDLVKEDVIRQGTLYNPKDYPSLEDITGRFKVTLSYNPMPTEGDFRVEMDPEMLETFRKEQQEKLQAGVQESYDKIVGALKHLRTTLDGYGPGKRLFKSTVGNLVEIAEALPGLNISGDPKLDELAEQIKAQFSGVDVDILKDNPTMREDVSRRTTSILDTIEGLATQAPVELEATPEDCAEVVEQQAILSERELELKRRLGL